MTDTMIKRWKQGALSMVAALLLGGAGGSAVQAQSPVIGYDHMGQCVPKSVYTTPNSIARNRFLNNPSPKTRNAVKQLERVQDFYQQVFNWSGPINLSTPIYLSTNVGDRRINPNTGQARCSGMNASMGWAYRGGQHNFWMTVLYTKANSSLDLADDMDVLGHEYTHGVFFGHIFNTQQRFSFDLGAINEGFSDVFGLTARAWYESGRNISNTVVRGDSFYMGRLFGRIIRPGSNVPMRDTSNPSRTGVMDYYPDYIINRARLRSVHGGSGVISLPYKLMVAGGRHPRSRTNIMVNGMGFEKSIKIFFYIIKNKLAFSDYRSFANAARNAARNIYGINSEEYITTDRAFAAVGLPLTGKYYPPTQPKPTSSQPPRTTPTKIPEPPKETVKVPTTQPDPNSGKKQPEVAKKSGPEISGPALMGALVVIFGSLLFIGSTLHRRRMEAVSRQQYRPHHQFENPGTDFGGAGGGAVGDPAPVKKAVLKKKSGPRKSTSGGGGACLFSVGGRTVPVSLSAAKLTLGREMATALELKELLMPDSTISRQHCDLWYKAEGNYLYAYCHSANGMMLAGHKLAQGEKAKVDFAATLTVTIGQTEIQIIKS